MKKRFLLCLISVVAVICTLAGCSTLFGGTGNNAGNNQNGDNQNGGTQSGDTKLEFSRMVIADDGIDTTEIRTELIAMGKMLGTVKATESAIDGEIVFGDTDRAVTVAAKAALEELIAKDGSNDTGYIVYCDGKNVAVYWVTDSAKVTAMAYFLSDCVKDKKLELEDGIISSELYLESVLVSEAKWIALESKCDPDVYSALRKFSTYYDKEVMMGWFANLFDAEIGGFYFSISARDNEPFLPDIESTNQALGWLSNNGFISNWNEEFPDDLKILLVDFAKSLQSSTDGYFYHPQWPQGRDKLNVDRYSRDLSWAIAVINRFKIDRDGDGVAEKQYPNYCAPEGTKCKEHAENGGSCSFASAVSADGALSSLITSSPSYVTASVQSNVSSAVSLIGGSTVTPVAASIHNPDYSSAAAFRAWLEAVNSNMGSSSGEAQEINALQDTIIAKGYCGVLLDFLDEKQQQIYDETVADGGTPTGLWTYDHTYNTVWGLLKYTPFYNNDEYGRELKYAEEIVRACIKVIMLPADKDYMLNDVYNQWQGMQALFNNVKKYSPNKLESLYEIVREGGAELIENTILKLADFKCGDGAFSFYTTRKSPFTMYGTQTAMGVEESDVNATVLATSTYRCAFSCFGYDVIKLGTSYDGQRFVQMLQEVEPIEKKPVPVPYAIEFDADYDFEGVKHDNQSGSSTITVEEDDTLDSDNYVLKYTSSATQTSYGDGVYFNVRGTTSMNCTIFESDICVISSSGNNDIMQIRLGDFYRLRINRNGNTLRIYEMIESTNGDVQPAKITEGLSKSLTVGEWFKLRIEAYRSDEEYDVPRFKIFINDEYVTETNCSWGANTSVNESCSQVLFRSLAASVSEVLFDNCFFYAQYKDYECGETEIMDDRNE